MRSHDGSAYSIMMPSVRSSSMQSKRDRFQSAEDDERGLQGRDLLSLLMKVNDAEMCACEAPPLLQG